MTKYDPNKERLGSQAKALQRIARNYPEEYEKICQLRQAHDILYKLPADQFDKICVEALHGLVNEGICKRPQQISFNQR
jgi:hypothetical protein